MVRCRPVPCSCQSSGTNGSPGACSLYGSDWKLPEGQGLAQNRVPSLTPIFHCPDQILWPTQEWGREILIYDSFGGQGSRWRPKRSNNNQMYHIKILYFPWHRCLDNCTGPCTFTEASLFSGHFGFSWNASLPMMKIPSSKQVFINRKAMRTGTFWISFWLTEIVQILIKYVLHEVVGKSANEFLFFFFYEKQLE